MREICVLIFRVKDGRGVDVSFGLVSREYLLTCGWFGKHSLVYVGVRTEHCANISGLVAFILSRRSISTCWCSFLTFRPKILQNTGSGKKDIHNSQAQLNYWYLNLGWAIFPSRPAILLFTCVRGLQSRAFLLCQIFTPGDMASQRASLFQNNNNNMTCNNNNNFIACLKYIYILVANLGGPLELINWMFNSLTESAQRNPWRPGGTQHCGHVSDPVSRLTSSGFCTSIRAAEPRDLRAGGASLPAKPDVQISEPVRKLDLIWANNYWTQDSCTCFASGACLSSCYALLSKRMKNNRPWLLANTVLQLRADRWEIRP